MNKSPDNSIMSPIAKANNTQVVTASPSTHYETRTKRFSEYCEEVTELIKKSVT